MTRSFLNRNRKKTNCPDCGRFILPNESQCYCGCVHVKEQSAETKRLAAQFTVSGALLFWFPILGLLITLAAHSLCRKGVWYSRLVELFFLLSCSLHIYLFVVPGLKTLVRLFLGH